MRFLGRRSLVCLFAAIAGWAPAGRLAAQSNDEIQTATQFNVSTPGARSLGLGGAFVAVADDATAAYANPAGLAQLIDPEASLEVRGFAYRSRFAERGHTPPTALTGIGIDVVDGIQTQALERRANSLSFASYVHTGRRWAVALHYHQLADFAAGLDTQGLFVGQREDPLRLSPARSELELEIGGLAASGAFRVTDEWTVGASVARYEFTVDSRTERFARRAATGDFATDSLTGAFYGPADFRPQNVLAIQTQEGDDDGLGWTIGILWKPDSRWSIGAVRRDGPGFDFHALSVDGPASDTPGRVDSDLGGDGEFRVPDVLAAGVAYRPADNWLIALDWTRVEYSDLRGDMLNLLQAARNQLAGFQVDDADELHLGAEYQALAPRFPWAIRLGTWLDPDHRLRFEGQDRVLRARFRAGDDEWHVAAGCGMVLGRFQVDLAYDHAPSSDVASLSGVLRF